jgi:hypothetical protein
MKKIISVGFVFVFSFLFFKSALAAQFFFSPDKGDVITGQQFDVSVKIKTDGDETLNGAQAKITFDANLLQVVSISKENSLFNLWIQDPAYSNADGTIDFIGGVSGGISGDSLQGIKISFKAKSEGTANLSVNQDESQITANDGLGTNILTQVLGAIFKITAAPPPPVVKPGVPPPPVVVPTPPIAQVPPPIQIVRPVIISKKLPITPELQITLYPNPEQWYNKSVSFLAQWPLPEDITGIVSSINKNSSDILKSPKSEGLFENKVFPPVEEGINYLHIAYENTAGRGKPTNYKLAIDTTPPLSFEVTAKEGSSTSNAQPTLTFATDDQLSGIDYYQIKIPGFDPIITKETSYKLPLLSPGNYRVSVKAFDKAGNASESILQLNILPIASPEILFFNKIIYLGTDSLSVKGTALPNSKVLISIKKLTGETFFSSVSSANDRGYWEAVLTPSFKTETYYLEAKTQDQQGALSLPVKSTFIEVKEKPVFALAGFEISLQMLLGAIIFILLSGFLAGFLFFKGKEKKRSEKVGLNIVVAEKDILAMLATLNEDLEKINRVFEDNKVTKSEVIESKTYLKRVKEELDKAKKYIIEEIEEIDD